MSDTKPIAAVMIHVSDVEAGLSWYQAAFPGSQRQKIAEFDFIYLDYKSTMLEIVKADDKVASGAAGSVVYWHVDDFQQRLDHLISLGASLYRGPINIENDMKMCQVKDIWGNCIGIRGKE